MSESECVMKLMKVHDAVIAAINVTDFKQDKALQWISENIQPLHNEYAEMGYSSEWAAKVVALQFGHK